MRTEPLPSSPTDSRPDTIKTTRTAILDDDIWRDDTISFDEQPVAIRSVGDRSHVTHSEYNRPREFLLWNDGPERTLDVTVHGDALGGVLDWQPTVPASRYVEVTLARPDRYTVVVGTAESRDYTMTVDRDWFDCTESWRTIVVRPDGRVEYARGMELATCFPRTVTPE